MGTNEENSAYSHDSIYSSILCTANWAGFFSKSDTVYPWLDILVRWWCDCWWLRYYRLLCTTKVFLVPFSNLELIYPIIAIFCQAVCLAYHKLYAPLCIVMRRALTNNSRNHGKALHHFRKWIHLSKFSSSQMTLHRGAWSLWQTMQIAWQKIVMRGKICSMLVNGTEKQWWYNEVYISKVINSHIIISLEHQVMDKLSVCVKTA